MTDASEAVSTFSTAGDSSGLKTVASIVSVSTDCSDESPELPSDRSDLGESWNTDRVTLMERVPDPRAPLCAVGRLSKKKWEGKFCAPGEIPPSGELYEDVFLWEIHPLREKLPPNYIALMRARGINLHDLTDHELGDHDVYVPWKYAKRLWMTSWALVIPALIGMRLRIPLAILGFFVFVTSINHWRKPRCDWRRLMDMSGVLISIIAHGFKAYYLIDHNPAASKMWFALLVLALFSYAIGRTFGGAGNYNVSTRFHQMLHTLGCVGNCLLYYSLSSIA
eukprot:Selendium_serpulae@DN3886_c0_g1_i3.p1